MEPARPYHHGSLKEALLEAAVALTAETGAQAFTLREVARRAGVSHNAPYRHFRDKEELLAGVAAQGFTRLSAAMQKGAARGKTPLERLRLSGRAYVDFAQRWPQHFQVMFELPDFGGKYPEYEAAGREAFNLLLARIVESQEAGMLPRGAAVPLALVAWSTVHGVAKLAVGGRMPFPAPRVLDFTDYATMSMVQGMANVAAPALTASKS